MIYWISNILEDLKKDAREIITLKTKVKYEYKINMNCLIWLFNIKMIEIAIENNDEKRKKLHLTLLRKIKTNHSFTQTTRNTNN